MLFNLALDQDDLNFYQFNLNLLPFISSFIRKFRLKLLITCDVCLAI